MSELRLGRLPNTDDELWAVVKALWDVNLPRHSCDDPEHTAPFTAFADAYFGRNGTITLWHGSRGLSGKSFMLSILGITKAFLQGADVNLLGGSLAQSANIHEHMRMALNSANAPRYMIETESQTLIKLNNNARIRPLTASQKTVRGPHPPFLILDEIDEMDLDILDAALGQPMPQRNYLGEILKPYTVMCSTWQNPEGCMGTFTPIYTKRGQIPIKDVVIGDEVMTRDGWRRVSNSIDTGLQECVVVSFASGRSITCTPWHPVWTQAGWVRADSLTPFAHVGVDVLPMAGAVGSGPDAFAGDTTPLVPELTPGAGVPVVADLLGDSDLSGAGIVLGRSDGFQMPGVDTIPPSAGVVQVSVVGDGADDLLVDPAVSQDDTLLRGSVALVSVPVLTDVQRPEDALVGIQVQSVVAKTDLVVSVTHTGMVLPTWDLTVEDTHEYVAGDILVHNTFTEIIRRFEERGLPIVRWCYKCSANPIDGWLTQETIDAKKQEIPAEMWRTEYELGEPAIGNRAFDPDAVERTFSLPFAPLAQKEAKDFEEFRFEEPVKDGFYVAAADWAKEKDYTVISVMRYDCAPARLVYWMRVNRRPYPMMIDWFNKAIRDYDAMAIHDATGLGNVVNDYLDIRAKGFLMTGRDRDNMLSEYVSAVENDKVRVPKIKTAYIGHKYCQVGDLYARGQEYHLPDEVCSLALAWRVIKRNFAGGAPTSLVVPRSPEPSPLDRVFAPPPLEAEKVVVTTEPVTAYKEVVVRAKGPDDNRFNLLV